MRRNLLCICGFCLLAFNARWSHAADQAEKPTAQAVIASVESSLTTSGANIRQLAMDGNEKTYFLSVKKPTADDRFTLVLNQAVAVKSVNVQTGTPAGENRLTAGKLQWSADGKTFEDAATFADGHCTATLDGKSIRALRIQPTGDATGPLAIAEITMDSSPRVAAFVDPIEFTVDVSDAPEMKDWADKTARTCEQQYPMINQQLKSAGYHPPRQVTMTISKTYVGVAATSGSKIVGAVKWFKAHPDDVGAMVHETVHVVQHYRGRGNPGWLVEGVADYVRFFHYEPGHLGPIDAQRSHYNGSYRVTAAFLNYCLQKYDKDLVLKLNEALRNGQYDEALWEKMTGKTLPVLDEEWRATLKKK